MSLNVGIERLCEPVSNGELSQDGRTQESVYDEGDESVDVPVQRTYGAILLTPSPAAQENRDILEPEENRTEDICEQDAGVPGADQWKETLGLTLSEVTWARRICSAQVLVL